MVRSLTTEPISILRVNRVGSAGVAGRAAKWVVHTNIFSISRSVCFFLASLCASVLILALAAGCGTTPVEPDNSPFDVKVETSMGAFVLRLYPEEAPLTTKNFLDYIDNGDYENTIFHRVMDGFMVQGGGFGTDFKMRPIGEPLLNEAANGLKNTRGTVAMARTPDPHSARQQFFINLVDNPFLDHRNTSHQGFGYCVFGEVTEGMDVVDAIGKVPVCNFEGHQNVPVENVVIMKMTRQ